MTNNGKVFLGIITAAAAGAVIGLLFAPEEGNKTREKMRKGVNDLADELLDAIQKGKEKAGGLAEEARNKAYELRGKAESKWSDIKDDASNLADDARNKAYEAKGKAESKWEDTKDEAETLKRKAQSNA
jgi:gas vesicle protein